MIEWWWLIIVGMVGYMFGCLITSIMAINKIKDMAEEMEEEWKKKDDGYGEWDKWGHKRR